MEHFAVSGDVQLFAKRRGADPFLFDHFLFVALPCETPKSVKPLTVSRAFSTFWLCKGAFSLPADQYAVCH
ncbi:hypothetical protein ACVXHA_09785 [Escherichia coli]